jgi:hypothetical protein
MIPSLFGEGTILKGDIVLRRFHRTTQGVYYACSGILAILQTAHTSLQGFAWLINPVDSEISLFVRRIEIKYSAIDVADADTRLTAERITFPDGPATDVVAAIQRHSAEPVLIGHDGHYPGDCQFQRTALYVLGADCDHGSRRARADWG